MGKEKGGTNKATAVFNCRVPQETLDSLKAYCKASDQTIGAVVSGALAEYLKKHPLKGTQLQVYDLILKS